MKLLPQSRLLPLVALVAWVGACVFSTEGLQSNATSGTGGHGGTASSSSGMGGDITVSSSSSSTSSSGGGMTTSSSTSSSSGGCLTGMKQCGANCVPMDDPAFGCGDLDCNPCTNPHGGLGCSNGACAPSCDQGFGDCDSNTSNGCETDVGTLTDCGGCGIACTNAHGSTACTNGVCVPKCDTGFGDCNGNPNDGCGADLNNSTNNCGACGTKCTNAHGTTTCTNGKCVPTCDAGYDDCNGNPNDGCEANLNADPFNCGTCKRKCSGNHVAAMICTSGLCTSTCDLGFGNCNKPAGGDDGCEKDVTTDNNNCGGCGNSCVNGNIMTNPGCDQGSATQKFCGCSSANECKWGSGTNPTCTSGLCKCGNSTCQPGEVCKNIGAGDQCTCYGGNACAMNETCCQGPAGCFNLDSDPANCGACGHACAPGFTCVSGACSCNANAANCNGGAPAGTFTCPSIPPADVCVCNSGATTCANGQRCLPDNTCG